MTLKELRKKADEQTAEKTAALDGEMIAGHESFAAAEGAIKIAAKAD